MTKQAKPTKALERCAREIHNSDDFVQHVANIAHRYRREYAQEQANTVSEQRKVLRALEKHAGALNEWLRASQTKGTLENATLSRLGVASDGIAGLFREQSRSTLEWLTKAHTAAQQLLSEKTARPSSIARDAAVMGTAATFEFHKLKWSTALSKRRQSDAIRLLVVMAKHAGDVEGTPEALRESMLNLANR